MTENCPDCAVSIDMPHQDGCDIARCSICGFQRLECGHCIGNGGTWTGRWPGDLECEEWDLWCYWAPPLIPCTKDHPFATQDLNRLSEMALRGEIFWNGERWVYPTDD